MLSTDNRWVAAPGASGSFDRATAIDSVATRNGYDGVERKEFVRAVKRLFARTPKAVLERCSIRLLKRGRNLSVNAGNHCLFRLPAYSDAGRKQDADAFVVWPTQARMSAWTHAQQAASTAYEFKLFDAVILTMSAGEILAMTKKDWSNYRSACEDALNCRRTRDWPSNVVVGTEA
jgi:hypothetical protein